jgi:sec-independent protein translocase protein TatC
VSPETVTPEDDPVEQTRMSLSEHLEELRKRLFRGVLAVAICFVGCWVYREDISTIALGPLGQTVEWLDRDMVEIAEKRLDENPGMDRSELFLTSDPGDQRLREPIRKVRGDAASTGFMYYVKVCVYFSLFLSGPVLLWQLWQFIAAGLYRNEKHLVHVYFPFSVLLFVGGILFGYFLLVPYGQYYLASMTIEQILFDPEVTAYFGFLTSLCIALGAVFQLPILMVGMARMGLVEVSLYGKYRGHFMVGALFLAAVLTPPDPFTQMLMGLPMIVLYELGIHASRFTVRRAARKARNERT